MLDRDDYEFEDAQRWFRYTWNIFWAVALINGFFHGSKIVGVVLLILASCFLFFDIFVAQMAIDHRNANKESKKDEDN